VLAGDDDADERPLVGELARERCPANCPAWACTVRTCRTDSDACRCRRCMYVSFSRMRALSSVWQLTRSCCMAPYCCSLQFSASAISSFLFLISAICICRRWIFTPSPFACSMQSSATSWSGDTDAAAGMPIVGKWRPLRPVPLPKVPLRGAPHHDASSRARQVPSADSWFPIRPKHDGRRAPACRAKAGEFYRT